MRFKNFVVLIELAADGFGVAQVLHRAEVNDIFLDAFKVIALVEVDKIRRGAENFIEVIIPARVDNGAMSKNNRLSEVHTADDFEGARRLSETHFGMPEKFFARLEIINGAPDSLFLFVAENYFGNYFASLHARKILPAELDGFNRANCRGEVNLKPFAGGGAFELNFLDSGMGQHAMDVIIPKSLSVVSYGKCGVRRKGLNAYRVGVLLNAFDCSFV